MGGAGDIRDTVRDIPLIQSRHALSCIRQSFPCWLAPWGQLYLYPESVVLDAVPPELEFFPGAAAGLQCQRAAPPLPVTGRDKGRPDDNRRGLRAGRLDAEHGSIPDGLPDPGLGFRTEIPFRQPCHGQEPYGISAGAMY